MNRSPLTSVASATSCSDEFRPVPRPIRVPSRPPGHRVTGSTPYVKLSDPVPVTRFCTARVLVSVRSPHLARWTNFTPSIKKCDPSRRTKKLWSAGPTWSTARSAVLTQSAGDLFFPY